jgi:hypothetical protein
MDSEREAWEEDGNMTGDKRPSGPVDGGDESDCAADSLAEGASAADESGEPPMIGAAGNQSIPDAPTLLEPASQPEPPGGEIPLEAELAQVIADARHAAQLTRGQRAIELPSPGDSREPGADLFEAIAAPGSSSADVYGFTQETWDTFSRAPAVPQSPRGPFGPIPLPTAPSPGEVQKLREPVAELEAVNASLGNSELSDHSRGFLCPTSDGGPPLARPIVLVSLPADETRRMIQEILETAATRDSKVLGEIAEAAVYDAFWHRDCEERAIMGDY